MKKEKLNSIKNIIKYILIVIITICMIYNIMFTIHTTISKTEYFELCGFSFFCMSTDGMSGDIEKNDLIIVKKVKEQELQKGDIIAYHINEKVRINKIIEVQDEYTTKSNANYYSDIEKITNEQIIGKEIIVISGWGKLISILQSKVSTAIMLVVLSLKFLYDRYLYKQKEIRIRKMQLNEFK